MTERAPAPESPKHGLIARLIASCAARPYLTILFVAAFAAWGFVSLRLHAHDGSGRSFDQTVIRAYRFG